MLRWLAAAFAALMFHAVAMAAEEPELTPEQKAEIQRLITLRDSLKPQYGEIRLPEAKAKLNLGKDYYFLGPADAKRVLVEGWGNAPGAGDGVLGLIFPKDRTFLDDTWGAVVTFAPTGYVSDKDAKTTDYQAVLEGLREGEGEANAERKKAGYEAIRLIGWAQAPSYDPARHDLIWARELKFGEQTDNTLNYDVRHLGREGVLSLNMVSVMSQLPAVRESAQALARTAEFEAGAQYADFREGDQTAGFGLAGLVAAGAGVAVAKKAGLIAIILAFAKKGLGILVVGGIAAFAWIRRLMASRAPKKAPAQTTNFTGDDAPGPDDPSGTRPS